MESHNESTTRLETLQNLGVRFAEGGAYWPGDIKEKPELRSPCFVLVGLDKAYSRRVQS